MVVQLNRGHKIFRSTCVEPWAQSQLGRKDDSTTIMGQGSREDQTMTTKQMIDDVRMSGDEVDLGNVARKIKFKKGSREEMEFAEFQEI